MADSLEDTRIDRGMFQDGEPRGLGMGGQAIAVRADLMDHTVGEVDRGARSRLIPSMLGAVGYRSERMFKTLLPTALRSLFAAHDFLIDR